MVDDIGHEGLRSLIREEGVSFQRVTGWKTSRGPDYAARKARVEHREPDVIVYIAESGPLNLQPHAGRQWAGRGGRHKDPDRETQARRRATYTRPRGVRYLFAAYDRAKDQLYGRIKKTKNRSKPMGFCRYPPAPPINSSGIGPGSSGRGCRPATRPCRTTTWGTRGQRVRSRLAARQTISAPSESPPVGSVEYAYPARRRGRET